jgi:hypothetical protein
VRQAFEASDPRWALREAVRDALRHRLLSRDAMIAVLDELADEYEAAGSESRVTLISEVLDILEGHASDYGIAAFFNGLPSDLTPRRAS